MTQIRGTYRRVALVAAFSLLSAAPGRAQQAGDAITKLEDRAQHAVKRGLEFLKSTQNEDGSWTEKVGRKVHMEYRGERAKHVGVTALACMAFLANGSLPESGEYAEQIEKGLDFVLDCVQVNGFVSANETRMYSHAFATLFLAEVYGMTRMERVRDKLKRAIDLIVQAQNSEGGWRYLPGSEEADMSITVCQVMALRAARNAGIHVPKHTIDEAIKYVKSSYDHRTGGFHYQLPTGPDGRRQPVRVTFPLTAAGVTALYGAGEYGGKYIEDGLEYMRQTMPGRSDASGNFDYYYGMYYATQAAFQRGGGYWNLWQAELWDDLLYLQNKAGGYWEDLVGKNYATAMACIILQIPYQYLPIFER
ncbi:MAG: terpene cyclase/mutase family protein [Planctomycetes bacterium]|nr:terpene cyclase/mutase family protein [Planctomycetota bacterium]